MEQAIVPPAYNPHLKRVLKSFQDAAIKSLSGPSNYVNTWGDPSKLSPTELEEYRKALLSGALKYQMFGVKEKEPYVSPPAVPVQQVPFFLPMDSSRGEKSETILEGETIACFIVGGEKRLCLPQILNTVLQDFTLQQINNICDDLHIFCSRCSPEQLETLKLTGVLPWSAPSCGLITKTDAERLCNALLHRHPEKSVDPPSINSFKVYHECFGKCKGIFNPDLYITPYAKCIECCDCHGLFSPQKFVCHSHKALENRTCHWGFDSANWRSYLLLAKDQTPRDRLQEILEQLKSRFDYLNKFKRKQSLSPTDSDSKRAKLSEEKKSPTGSDSSGSWTEAARENSAFRPWSPSVLNAVKDGKLGTSSLRTVPSYLKTGPPVLLNPERVIPFSEKNRYERNFAPNVSLAPASQQKDGKYGDEDDDEDLEDVNLSNVKVEDRVRVKVESPLEIDVSSDDTDTSSLFNNDSVPSTPREETSLHLVSPDADASAREREQELALLQRALAGQVGLSTEAKDAYIQEFLKLRVQQEERLAQLVQANKALQQELERVKRSRKEKQRQYAESENNLRREIQHLIQTNEENTKILSKECAQLRQDSEVSRGQKQPEYLKMKAKFEYQVESLQNELESSEETKKKLLEELEKLRTEVEVLQSQKRPLVNGNHTHTDSDTNGNSHILPEKNTMAAKTNGLSTEVLSHHGSEAT